MAKKTEVTVEEKLRALYDLQLIDSRVDEIRNVRGELPLEVEDLENEIAGLQKRMDDFQQELNDFEFQTKEQKNRIEVAKEEFKKYEENLKNVRNNREYNSIVKEQEFQELEIQLAEKKIKEFITKHLFERRFFYEQAKIILSTDAKSILEITTALRIALH